jgi:poly(3-hydroxybutyrate) depolymerase
VKLSVRRFNPHRRAGVLLVAALAFSPSSPAQPATLQSLAAGLELAADGISVSGISSGAYMAQQFHVAHSQHVMGAGLIAGGPYRCAAGSYPPYSWFDVTGLYAATSKCSDTNPVWFYQGPPDETFSVQATRDEAGAGRVDDIEGLRGDRVWLFSGGEDETVPRDVVEALERYYAAFVHRVDLHHERHDRAGHTMPTEDFGNTCGASESPFISDCNFDAAERLLKHVYRFSNPKAAPGKLQPVLAFDQSAFFDTDDPAISMNSVAHLYVPAACRAGKRCRLHVAFHGCKQYQELIGDDFYTEAGYNDWAETNRIVVLYPQTAAWSSAFGFGTGRNPNGCWDWWGYSGADYHRKDGKQMRAVAAMINVLLGTQLLR